MKHRGAGRLVPGIAQVLKWTMHPSSMERMSAFRDRYLEKRRDERLAILDVGSGDVNGTYRELFTMPTWRYTGLDMAPGKNVDLVPRDPYFWHELAAESFDVVISGQAFEHVEFFWETIREIARVLKRQALCCIIAPSAAPEHRHPVDCWRFYPDGFSALARYAGLEVLEVNTDWNAPDRWFADTVLVCRKPREDPGMRFRRTAWRWLSHLLKPRLHDTLSPSRCSEGPAAGATATSRNAPS